MKVLSVIVTLPLLAIAATWTLVMKIIRDDELARAQANLIREAESELDLW